MENDRYRPGGCTIISMPLSHGRILFSYDSFLLLLLFQARIAFLQGERKGQENLKNDLVRRIKMLEYALKQERAKYNKLKYGSESSTNALDAALNKANEEEDQPPGIDGDNYIAVSNVNWRQGRQLLRQ